MEEYRPNYFERTWEKKTDLSLSIIKKEKEFYCKLHKCLPLLIFGVLAAISAIFLAWVFEKYDTTQPATPGLALCMMGGFLVHLIVACLVTATISSRKNAWEVRLKEFENAMDSIAFYLKMSRAEIEKCDFSELQAIAIRCLKGLCGYLKKIQAIVDNSGEAKETIQNLENRASNCYKNCAFWKLIEETGWQKYFG